MLQNNIPFIDKIEKAELLDRLANIVRIVDPVNKTVINNSVLSNGEQAISSPPCYCFWDRNEPCENCISMRAYLERETCVKIEYKAEQVYLVTALPLQMENEDRVLELIKDITNTGIVDIENKERNEIKALIEQKNNVLMHDPLTGLHNYDFIYSRLPFDIAKAYSDKTPLSLIFVNINNFTAINNSYGYNAGNYVILEYSKILKANCIDGRGWIGRYFGLQFIMLLRETDEYQANRICKQILEDLTKTAIKYEGNEIKLSTSIGYHTVNNELITSDDLIRRASNKLFFSNEAVDSDKLDDMPEEIAKMYSLTVSEQRVASMLLEGKSNLEIAESLFVTNSTVKKHVSSIFNKLSIKTRAEFIAKFK
jgi:diguanylate cyclase (GGDEF)-like protein